MSKDLQEIFNDRFIDRIQPDSNGCWVWQNSTVRNGYGMISTYFYGTVYAHQFSYAVFIGDLTDGNHTDHLCRNRACVNPEHLESVTAKENIHRGEAPTAINARKTQCKNGHSLENARLYTFGNRITRRCMICTRKYARERYQNVKNRHSN